MTSIDIIKKVSNEILINCQENQSHKFEDLTKTFKIDEFSKTIYEEAYSWLIENEYLDGIRMLMGEDVFELYVKLTEKGEKARKVGGIYNYEKVVNKELRNKQRDKKVDRNDKILRIFFGIIGAAVAIGTLLLAYLKFIKEK